MSAAIVEALRPLTLRMRTSDHWEVADKGPNHIKTKLSSELLLRHLTDPAFSVGLCPIGKGENTTRVALLDLDSHKGDTSWADMVKVAQNLSGALSLAYGLEVLPFRSSGGKGLHLYLLWDKPQDAYSVRRLLCEVLQSNGFENGTAGVKNKQIEVFPKQDGVEADRWGSMWVLPLSRKSNPLDPVSFADLPKGAASAPDWWELSTDVLTVEKPPARRLSPSEATDLAKLRSAMDAIGNASDQSLDYEKWRNVIFGIHCATGGSDEGLSLAHEFSVKSEKYDSEFLDNRVWPYIKPMAGGITAGSIFKMATEHGWDGFCSDDFFEDVSTTDTKKAFSLDDFALNGESDEMRNKMLDDVFIVGRLAILGQATVFYAQPNTGKTLLTMWLLIEAIKSGELKAEDVFYINADDTFKGLVTKLALAEQYGFKMLSPGHKGFSADKLLGYMATLVKQGDASGKVIILDTLKKFTDIMDKKISTAFGKAMREFVSNGGSVIMLAHVNKHKNAEGKVIHSGTSDISDDVDCAYTLEKVKDDNDTHTVIFENFKNRGDVASTATYSYTRKEGQGQTYQDLLCTVQSLSDDDRKRAKALKDLQSRLETNQSVIWAIMEALESGVRLKTEVLETARRNCGVSLSRVIKVLDEHTGGDYAGGDRWKLSIGEKNAKQYTALVSA